MTGSYRYQEDRWGTAVVCATCGSLSVDVVMECGNCDASWCGDCDGDWCPDCPEDEDED